MNTEQKNEEHAAILKMQKILLTGAHWRSCLNCDYFIHRKVVAAGQTIDTQICDIYKQTPPPEIIVNGCRDWEHDIPF